MSAEPLPPKVITKATNLVRDSSLGVVVGLIPILGLVYILRLVQWYLLKNEYPQLLSREPGDIASLAEGFRGAKHRLWFAVLFWPVVIGLALIVGVGYLRGVLVPTWLLWIFLLFLFGRFHARPLEDISILDPRRRALAIFSLALFFLVFVPFPLAGLVR